VVNDSLVQSNRTLHERLVELGVPHDYAERPGAIPGSSGPTPCSIR
jgi:hypothetical protein